MRLVYMFSGCLVPAMALWTVDRVFRKSIDHTSKRVLNFGGLSLIAAPSLTISHAVFFQDIPKASIPQVLTGIFTAVVFLVGLQRLFTAYQSAKLPVDKTRIAYLLVVSSSAIILTILEQTARAMNTIDPTNLHLAARGLALQGAIPPFSPILAGLAIYFFYSSIVMYRLLDLHELFSRAATLITLAAMLLFVDAITFIWVDTFTSYPLHSTFQIFIASLLFLAAYEPLRDTVSWYANRLFNQRGHQLQETLENLRKQLSTIISQHGLVDTLLSGLHSSGRVPVCSIYIWNQSLDAFACIGSRGHGDRRPLRIVAATPFINDFNKGTRWYNRFSLKRRARHDAEATELLGLMKAMNADLTLPFRSRGVVMGWMHIRDEVWSDGFSAEEIQSLQSLADVCAVVLSNIHDFQAMQEKNRLAALGAMAAGLAHEIRNPLAGVQGAAQYLQNEEVSDDAQEMLGIIVDEAHRLNIVVTQFLDYARPFELHLAPDHINALVGKGLSLLKAQGLSKNLAIHEDLSGDLPPLYLDGTRLSQVLINLLQNALQAMPEGGQLSVTTRRRQARHGNDMAEISIADTGVGISRDNLEKLFIPFFTTKEQGTGLGLAISQRIIQAHGGEIEAESLHGRGATFIVRLPIPEEAETESIREPTEELALP
jgi:signal transduction histidine kinase